MTARVYHDCSQSGNIKEIKDQVRQVEKEVSELKPKVEIMLHTLEGNGQKGIKDVVTTLAVNVSNLTEAIAESKEDRDALTNSINELLKFQNNVEASTRVKEKEASSREVRKAHLRWMIGVIITLVLGVATLSLQFKKEKNKVDSLKIQIENSK